MISPITSQKTSETAVSNFPGFVSPDRLVLVLSPQINSSDGKEHLLFLAGEYRFIITWNKIRECHSLHNQYWKRPLVTSPPATGVMEFIFCLSLFCLTVGFRSRSLNLLFSVALSWTENVYVFITKHTHKNSNLAFSKRLCAKVIQRLLL